MWATDARKNDIAMVMKRMMLLLAAYFAVLFVRHSHTRHALSDQMARLDRDLAALDSLRKQHDENQTGLRRDKRRVAELEERIRAMRSGFERTVQSFVHQKRALTEDNRALEEAVFGSAGTDGGHGEKRVSSLEELSREVSNTHEKMITTRHENAALRRILAEMSDDVERHKALRGDRRTDANKKGDLST